ncbi:hypothetical protein [Hyalangium minutum]|nr:hypothetical protein [Hyalangium minutum]
MGTAERPAYPNQGQPRTTTRPAMPAASFADALTPDPRGTKTSTAPETLVMPKVQTPEPSATRGGRTREMPALKDAPDPSAESTRIVKPSDLFGAKAPTTANRPAFRTSQVKGPLRPVEDLIPKNLNKLEDQATVAKRFASDLPLLNQQVRPSDLPPSERALRMWAFFTAYAEAAAGQEPMPEGQELFDKALEKEGFGEFRDKHTGQDGVKAGKWVLQSGSPEEAKERAEQVELEPPPEVLLSEAAKAQKQQKGQAPEAATKPEAQQKAQAQEAPAKTEQTQAPETPHPTADTATPQGAADLSEMAQPQDSSLRLEDPPRTDSLLNSSEMKDSAFGEVSDRQPKQRTSNPSEFVRLNPQQANVPPPVIQPPHPNLLRRPEDEEQRPGNFEEAWKKLGGSFKLGGNMLWNVLHRMRNGEDDSAIEKEKWNQIAFAAVLAFVGLMLLVILVVSL